MGNVGDDIDNVDNNDVFNHKQSFCECLDLYQGQHEQEQYNLRQSKNWELITLKRCEIEMGRCILLSTRHQIRTRSCPFFIFSGQHLRCAGVQTKFTRLFQRKREILFCEKLSCREHVDQSGLSIAPSHINVNLNIYFNLNTNFNTNVNFHVINIFNPYKWMWQQSLLEVLKSDSVKDELLNRSLRRFLSVFMRGSKKIFRRRDGGDHWGKTWENLDGHQFCSTSLERGSPFFFQELPHQVSWSIVIFVVYLSGLSRMERNKWRRFWIRSWKPTTHKEVQECETGES